MVALARGELCAPPTTVGGAAWHSHRNRSAPPHLCMIPYEKCIPYYRKKTPTPRPLTLTATFPRCSWSQKTGAAASEFRLHNFTCASSRCPWKVRLTYGAGGDECSGHEFCCSETWPTTRRIPLQFRDEPMSIELVRRADSGDWCLEYSPVVASFSLQQSEYGQRVST